MRKLASRLCLLLTVDMPPCSKNQSTASISQSTNKWAPAQASVSAARNAHTGHCFDRSPAGGDFYWNDSSVSLCFVMNGTMRHLSINLERLLCHYVTVPLSRNEGKCRSLNLLTESFGNNFCFDIITFFLEIK